MKKALIVAFAALALFVGTGCAYGGVGVSADGSTAVVARSDVFLFGLLRKVYVCQVTPAGLAQCSSNQSP